MPLTIQHRTGRLLELRLSGDLLPHEIQAAQREVAELNARARGRFIALVDARDGNLLSPATQQVVVAMLRQDSTLFDQVAMLVGSATLGLQVNRLTREAQASANRKVSASSSGLLAWLEPHLTRDEQRAASAFFPPGRTSTAV